MRPLLVGEANPYGGDPGFALYPSPRGCSGERLCRLVFQMDPDRYLEAFDRANLCPREWSLLQAQSRAAVLLVEARACGQTVVCLGAKVARVCASRFEPFAILPGTDLVPKRVILPHPSGLSRAWNVPGAYDRARAVLREAGVLPCSS